MQCSPTYKKMLVLAIDLYGLSQEQSTDDVGTSGTQAIDESVGRSAGSADVINHQHLVPSNVSIYADIAYW